MSKYHIPVLVEELKTLLNLKPGDNAIDATLDGGGHARMMLKLVSPDGKVLGIDQDIEMVKKMSGFKNLVTALGNFRNIDKIAGKNNFKGAKAILFDLGMSTWHIEASGRGFSFQRPDEPLLMQLSAGAQKSAASILNAYSEAELTKIFREFGEVRAPGWIARKIISARRMKRIYSVGDLLKALGVKNKKALAKIFQALRIAVNEELEALNEGLKNGFHLLSRGGRMAIISYHSLEDRAVKVFFRNCRMFEQAQIITKKPVMPAFVEIRRNPSSRSAKLRVLEKI